MSTPHCTLRNENTVVEHQTWRTPKPVHSVRQDARRLFPYVDVERFEVQYAKDLQRYLLGSAAHAVNCINRSWKKSDEDMASPYKSFNGKDLPLVTVPFRLPCNMCMKRSSKVDVQACNYLEGCVNVYHPNSCSFCQIKKVGWLLSPVSRLRVPPGGAEGTPYPKK